jgi:hypothetical protein
VTITCRTKVFVTESVRFVTIAGSIGVFVKEIVCFVTIAGSAGTVVTESGRFVIFVVGSFLGNDKSPPGIGARRGFMFLGRGGVTCF